MKTDCLLERHHVDLATVRQQGPTWHYQYGGNPKSPVGPLPTSWLDEPRWPVAPLDVTLLLESLVANFFPDAWGELTKDGQWLNLIYQAEDLVVKRYAELIHGHFSGADREMTWLMNQDNSEFDPRPA